MYPRIPWELVADPLDRTVREPVVYAVGSSSDAEHGCSGRGDEWKRDEFLLTLRMCKYGNVWGQQAKGKCLYNVERGIARMLFRFIQNL